MRPVVARRTVKSTKASRNDWWLELARQTVAARQTKPLLCCSAPRS